MKVVWHVWVSLDGLLKGLGFRYTTQVISAVIRSLRPLSCAVASALLFASSLFVSADSSWFTRSWQTDDGLPDNYVAAVAQSDDDFLWLGTATGLQRFDGVHFQTFSFDNADGRGDQGVRAISSRRGGGLWIVPRRGPVFGLDENYSRISLPGDLLSGNGPLGVMEDRQGTLWVAYPGFVCELKNGAVTQFASNSGVPASGTFFGFAADTENNIWLAKGSRALVLQDGVFQSVNIPGTLSRVVHLTPSRSNGVWIAASKHLFKCEAGAKPVDCGSFEADNPRAETWALLEDHTGAVWLGTDGSGLFRYAGSGFEKIETSHPYILGLTEDKEGNVWVGTSGGGLDRVGPGGVRLESFDTGSSTVAIQSICEDTNGVLWGATQNGLLVSRRDGRWVSPFTNAASLGIVTCVAADRNGAVWIGSRDRMLYRWFNNHLTTWGRTNHLASHTVVGLLSASNGDLWISIYGNPSAVQRMDTNDQLATIKLPASVGRISAMAEDTAGTIWIGSANGNLMQIEPGDFTATTISAASVHQPILCLYATPDGAVWIGYEGGGLGRIKDGSFSNIGSVQGLPGDHVSEIASDEFGWFWFGGGRGIFKVQGSELESIMDGRLDHLLPIRYGRNEGLFSVEANSANVAPFVLPTVLRSHDGTLWMPLRKQIAAVDPKVLREKSSPPEVIITRVAMDNRAVAEYGQSSRTQPVVNLKTLKIPLQFPPGHRKLEFEFTALNFSTPENVRIRYRLEGYDDTWQTPENRSAIYSGLGRGNYRFRVQANNGNGPWNEAQSPVAFEMLPFFWETLWFRSCMVILFTSAVIALVRYISLRRLQMKLRLVEQQAALDKERTRIARDLHDDLGCSLTKVALTLDMTHRQITSTEDANGKLQNCSTMVRQIARSVDEIVWAINPRNDTLRYLIDYISQFTVEFLHAAEIKCRVDLPDNIPDIAVSPEARHNLFLVVKEALNNVTRHARAGEVRLTVTASEREVTIALDDNGCGFNGEPDNATADGLRNMRQRMEEVGGRFELQSNPGTGTRVAFFCPLRNGHLN